MTYKEKSNDEHADKREVNRQLVERFPFLRVDCRNQQENEMRQLIIARKDLDMSPGKLAAQCCHASMAFLSKIIRDGKMKTAPVTENEESETKCEVLHIDIEIRNDIYENWLKGIFTKTICEAKNKNQLLKAVSLAEEMGLKEDRDFFFIKDNCLTELEPEEIGEDGIGRTLTCIGFRPLPDDITQKISRKYQLFK